MTQVQKGNYYYEPSLNGEGVYIDYLPITSQYIKCYCGTNTLFTTLTNLKSHFKTEKHTKHLEYLNSQQKNHLTELNKYKRLTKSQQQLIQQQQDIITTQEIQLDTLSRQLFDTKQKLEIIRKSVLAHID
jgi:hypothetical protein